jgi:hypothetical protein
MSNPVDRIQLREEVAWRRWQGGVLARVHVDCSIMEALLDEYDALTARCVEMQTRVMEAEERLHGGMPDSAVYADVKGLEDEAARLRLTNADLFRLLANARAAYDNACRDRDDEKARANRLAEKDAVRTENDPIAAEVVKLLRAEAEIDRSWPRK